jgi:hypothetical protein
MSDGVMSRSAHGGWPEALRYAAILWHRTDPVQPSHPTSWLMFRHPRHREAAQQHLAALKMDSQPVGQSPFIHRFNAPTLPQGSAHRTLFYPLQLSMEAEDYVQNMINAGRCPALPVGGAYRPSLDWAVEMEHQRDRIRVTKTGRALHMLLQQEAMLVHALHPEEDIPGISYVFFRKEATATAFRHELEKILPEMRYTYDPVGTLHRITVPRHGEMTGIALPGGLQARAVLEPFVPPSRVSQLPVHPTRKQLGTSKALAYQLGRMAESFGPQRPASRSVA